MAKNYIKMQVGNFSLHARKFRMASFVCQQKDCSQEIAFRCETSRFFSAENAKMTK